MCPTVQLFFGCLSALWWRVILEPKHVAVKCYGMWTAVVADSCCKWLCAFITAARQTENDLCCADFKSYRGKYGNVFVILVVTGTCECGNEPSGSIKCGEFLTSWKPVSFSRRTLLYWISKYCYYYYCYYYYCRHPPRQIFLGWSNPKG